LNDSSKVNEENGKKPAPEGLNRRSAVEEIWSLGTSSLNWGNPEKNRGKNTEKRRA
jgi:hypothetical protein